MNRYRFPFKNDLLVRKEGTTFSIAHVDFGSDRVQLKNVKTGVVEQHRLHKELSALYEGSIQLYDELGVLLDFSELSADVLALTDSQKEAFHLRAAFVRGLDPLGLVGPDNPALISAVEALNRTHRTDVAPSTAYSWLRIFREHGTMRALAKPRALSNERAARMHPLTREALDQELDFQTAAMEERLRDQRGKFKIRGRTHLSLNAIATNARARVKLLNVERHVELNKKRESEGLAPLPLPKPPAGPSRRTVQLEVCGKLSRHKLLESVYGPHVTARRLGPFGKSFELSRICERWETDVFLADILLTVIYQGVAVPVGIPYLTVIVDCFSGVVLAIVIEFKPPNYRSFLAALKQAYTPKDWLFEAFPGIRNHFTAHGAAEVIGFDNAGMFSTEDVRRTEAELSIVLEPAEPRTPNDKPHIEGFGDVINRTFIRYQVGNKHSIEQARKMEYDAYQQRAMPVEEFVRRLWEWVWNDLHERPMEDRHGWSRRQTWTHSLQTLAQSDDVADLFIFDKRVIDTEIAERHMLSYTDEGFTLAGRHYRSREMHEVAMNFPEKFKFDVREDVGDPRVVRVLHPQDGRVLEVQIASEMPAYLTANAFDHLKSMKAQMANPDLPTILEATIKNQEAWKSGKAIEHIPNTLSALRDIVSRKNIGNKINVPETQGNRGDEAEKVREALRRRFSGGAAE